MRTAVGMAADRRCYQDDRASLKDGLIRSRPDSIADAVFAVPFVDRFGDGAVHELLHMAIVDYVPLSNGAVFMGANTHSGNASNFMVKAIAEEAGVPMPSFFGYIPRHTLPYLITTFLVTTWLFFE
jgi:hypothetical protein